MKKLNRNLLLNPEFITEVQKGNVEGYSIVTKYGRNPNVGTSLVPLTSSGTYQTPTTLTSLSVLSTDIGDTAAGAGLRKIRVEGIVDGWVEGFEEIELNGTTTVNLTKQFYRVHRIIGIESGSYATATTPSQLGTITIHKTGTPAEVWGQISVFGGIGLGQSQIGVYTIPKGYTGILLSKSLTMDTGKVITTALLAREECDKISAPYGVMRLKEMEDGLNIPFTLEAPYGLGKFTGPCDIGFMCLVSVGTASISCDYQLLLIDNKYL